MRGSIFLAAIISCASLSLATWDHNLDGFGADVAVQSISPYNSIGFQIEAIDYGITVRSANPIYAEGTVNGEQAYLAGNGTGVWAYGGAGPGGIFYGGGSTMPGVFATGFVGVEASGGGANSFGIKADAYGNDATGVDAVVWGDYNPTGVNGRTFSNDNYSVGYGVKGYSEVSGTYAYATGVEAEAVGSGTANFVKGVNAYAHSAGSSNYGVYAVADAYPNSGSAVGIYAAGYDGYSYTAGVFDGDIIVNGTCYCTPSDQKLKKNVQPLNLGLSAVMAMQPKLYDMKVDEYKGKLNLAKGRQLGMIAQEVEKIVPQAVTEVKIPARENRDKDGKITKVDAVEYKTLNYVALIPVLIKAIQEQEAKIQALEKKLAAQ